MGDAIVECSKLPNVGIFQLFKEFLVFLFSCHSPNVVQDFLGMF